MQPLTQKMLAAADGEIWQYAEFSPSELDFSPEVVKACEANYCGNYNRCWTCPPNVGPLEELRKKYTAYEHVFCFTTKHKIEDSFDIEGMLAGRIEHDKTEEKIRAVLPEGCEVLGAEGCSVCEKCAFPEPCRFPDKKRFSVESCGINVVGLARDHGINYHNGENTVTYFSLVFWNGDEK